MTVLYKTFHADHETANFWHRFIKQHSSAGITVFQYGPTLKNVRVRWSLGNGLNLSNVEAPVAVQGGHFAHNRGHGIVAVSRFGNVRVLAAESRGNAGDGLKYLLNNTAWSPLEQREKFVAMRYIEFCDSQNPLSFPAYYRFRNPNYVRECSKTFSAGSALGARDQDLRITLHFQEVCETGKLIFS